MWVINSNLYMSELPAAFYRNTGAPTHLTGNLRKEQDRLHFPELSQGRWLGARRGQAVRQGRRKPETRRGEGRQLSSRPESSAGASRQGAESPPGPAPGLAHRRAPSAWVGPPEHTPRSALPRGRAAALWLGAVPQPLRCCVLSYEVERTVLHVQWFWNKRLNIQENMYHHML